MDKKQRSIRRKRSIRKTVSGTAERPRLAVHKTNKLIYAQVIDDVLGKTLCGVSTKAVKKENKAIGCRKNVVYADALGEKIAKKAIEMGIKQVVFDRSGYKYHGTVKALADGARKAGLDF